MYVDAAEILEELVPDTLPKGLSSSTGPTGCVAVPIELLHRLMFGCQMLKSEFEAKTTTGFRAEIINRLRRALADAETAING